MKLAEIKELTYEEMGDQVTKSRIELVDLRMKLAARQLENPSLIKKKRKEIARILTLQSQKLSEKGKNLEVGTREEDEKQTKEIKTKKKKESSKKEKKVEKEVLTKTKNKTKKQGVAKKQK